MTTVLEAMTTAILLILVVLLFTHMMAGDASTWLASKFKAAPA